MRTQRSSCPRSSGASTILGWDPEAIPKTRKDDDPEPRSYDVADHSGYEHTIRLVPACASSLVDPTMDRGRPSLFRA